MFIFIAILFTVYTILLAVFAQLWIGQLAIIPLVIAWSGLRSVSILPIVLHVLCILIAIYIWIKVFKELRAAKAGATPKLTKNVICMMILTVIFSFSLVSHIKMIKTQVAEAKQYKVQRAQLDRERERQLIESNRNAAQNCRNVENLCVTQHRVFPKRGNTFAESLNNANNLCADLGMRLPTKEEYDLLVKPLLDFKYKLEQNLSDEEFVELRDHYDANYHTQFWDDNFLTSSMVDGKAVTYKMKHKQLNVCRNVTTKNILGHVCIHNSLETPVVEYHDLGELADRRKYIEYSVHCVK